MSADPDHRAAVASLPSLLAIGAAFFLPFVKGCGQMVSPIGFVAEGLHKPGAVLWVAPRFWVAALLAGLTLLALWRRREPGRAAERLAFAGLAASVGALGMDWWPSLAEGRAAVIWTVALSLATGVAGWLLVSAVRRRGWARWERLIAAHAVLSSPLCGIVFEARSWRSVGAGGYCYVASIAILLWLFALSTVTSLRAARLTAGAQQLVR
jgi:hypothetical protein